MKAIVCLFDKQAQAYMQPMFVPAVGVAYRNISDEIARGGEGNVLASHPGDFVLMQLGTFDEVSGKVDTTGCPLQLVNVVDLKLPEA